MYVCHSLVAVKQGQFLNVMNRSTQIRNIKQKKCQISFGITFMLSPINHVRICYDKNRITHVLFSGHEDTSIMAYYIINTHMVSVEPGTAQIPDFIQDYVTVAHAPSSHSF